MDTEISIDCKTGKVTEKPFVRPTPAEPEVVSLDQVKAVLASLPLGLTSEQIDALLK